MSADELRRLATDLTTEAATLRDRASLVVRKTAHDIEADAKALAPVDTGNLRSSISTTVDGDGLHAEIGPTADYAVYVETGTSRAPAQPFLRPATDRRIPAFYQALEQVVGEGL